MNQKKLSFGNYVFVGSMLFGLFFGAGNLIFPVNMGQNAGANTSIANAGFLLTAVGLPFLGTLAMGVTNSSGVRDLAARVGKRYADIFTILLYATIGPFFVLPRLATTSFTIGITPFISKGQSTLFLALYSILFFCVAYLFARKPSRLMEYVGKWLNPGFLIFLSLLLILAFVKPLGVISEGDVSGTYVNAAFTQGLINGYNTLDVLGSLAFGVLVISAFKNLGLKQPKDIAKGTLKSGLIAVILMAVIYTAMSFVGAMSIGHFKISKNGGIALAQLSKYYLGVYGLVLLAVIVILATLKTAVGIIAAIGEASINFNKKVSYKWAIIVISVLPMIFANAGLDQIIKLSLPVLMFLYPLAITLVLLALLESVMGYRKPVYVWTTLFAGIAAVFDALNAMPEGLKKSSFVSPLLNLGRNLPLFAEQLGWVVPSLVGFAIGFLLSFRKEKKV
ncbi:MAG: branched-chain amino acid transport system II carrier protein [Streptococcaceae bacterium]|jgi:LIVCS family branched-chain amino acid:cation transporter|nr:branched-chain amino acid transport system II carrier protein [Streptococcaceae bacterium]